jgi:hypothetical protein
MKQLLLEKEQAPGLGEEIRAIAVPPQKPL